MSVVVCCVLFWLMRFGFLLFARMLFVARWLRAECCCALFLCYVFVLGCCLLYVFCLSYVVCFMLCVGRLLLVVGGCL